MRLLGRDTLRVRRKRHEFSYNIPFNCTSEGEALGKFDIRALE